MTLITFGLLDITADDREVPYRLIDTVLVLFGTNVTTVMNCFGYMI